MQNRSGGGGGPLNQFFNWSHNRGHSAESLSSEEYNGPLVGQHFRRWANHIWSVSNNVTTKLRDLLANSPSSHTTVSNRSLGDSCDGYTTDRTGSWTTAITDNSFSPHDYSNGFNTQHYHSHASSYYCAPGDSRFNRIHHRTEDHRMYQVLTNNLAGKYIPVSGNNPVSVLPRIHQQSQYDPAMYRPRHRSEYCYHNGTQWDNTGQWDGTTRCGGGGNLSYMTEYRRPGTIDHQSPEKMDAGKENDHKRETGRCDESNPQAQRTERTNAESESLNVDNSDTLSDTLASTQPDTDQSNDPDQEDGIEEVEHPRRDNVSLRNSDHSMKSKVKKVAWDLQLSDIPSQDSSSFNVSRGAVSIKSSTHSVILTVENNAHGPVLVEHELYESAESTFLKSEKSMPKHIVESVVMFPTYHNDAENNTDRSQNVTSTNCGNVQSPNEMTIRAEGSTDNNLKWSSVAESSVDSLLISLRQRMGALGIECTSQSTSLVPERTNEDSVSISGNVVTPFLEDKRSIIPANAIPETMEARPSFSERIQDIWRDDDTWANSLKDKICAYSHTTGKEVPIKMSLLGINHPPSLRGYFDEYNTAIRLANILERMIESKSEIEITPPAVVEAPKPPPRFGRGQSRTKVAHIGIQYSTPSSSSSFSPKKKGPKAKRVSQDTSKDIFPSENLSKGTSCFLHNHRTAELPLAAPRPLQVFTEQGIIPISSIQINPVVQQVHRFGQYHQILPPKGKHMRSAFSSGHGDLYGQNSAIIERPVIQEGMPSSIPDMKPKNLSSHLRFRSQKNRKETSLIDLVPAQVEEIQEKPLSVLEYQQHPVEEQCTQDEAQSQQGNDDDDGRATNSLPFHIQQKPEESHCPRMVHESISAKARSWLAKKFHANKSSVDVRLGRKTHSGRRNTLKGKMVSLFKYVRGKSIEEEEEYVHTSYIRPHSSKRGEAPTPPARRRKSCDSSGGRVCRRSNEWKLSKSIHWDLDGTISRSAESNKLHKSSDIPASRTNSSDSPIGAKRSVNGRKAMSTKGRPKYKATKDFIYVPTNKLYEITNKKGPVHCDAAQASKQLPLQESGFLQSSRSTMPRSDVSEIDEQQKTRSNVPLASGTSSNSLSVLSCQNSNSPNTLDTGKSSSSNLTTNSLSSVKVLACGTMKLPNTAPVSPLCDSNNAALREDMFTPTSKIRITTDSPLDATKQCFVKPTRSSLLRASKSATKRCVSNSTAVYKKLNGKTFLSPTPSEIENSHDSSEVDRCTKFAKCTSQRPEIVNVVTSNGKTDKTVSYHERIVPTEIGRTHSPKKPDSLQQSCKYKIGSCVSEPRNTKRLPGKITTSKPNLAGLQPKKKSSTKEGPMVAKRSRDILVRRTEVNGNKDSTIDKDPPTEDSTMVAKRCRDIMIHRAEASRNKDYTTDTTKNKDPPTKDRPIAANKYGHILVHRTEVNRNKNFTIDKEKSQRSSPPVLKCTQAVHGKQAPLQRLGTPTTSVNGKPKKGKSPSTVTTSRRESICVPRPSVRVPSMQKAAKSLKSPSKENSPPRLTTESPKLVGIGSIISVSGGARKNTKLSLPNSKGFGSNHSSMEATDSATRRKPVSSFGEMKNNRRNKRQSQMASESRKERRNEISENLRPTLDGIISDLNDAKTFSTVATPEIKLLHGDCSKCGEGERNVESTPSTGNEPVLPTDVVMNIEETIETLLSTTIPNEPTKDEDNVDDHLVKSYLPKKNRKRSKLEPQLPSPVNEVGVKSNEIHDEIPKTRDCKKFVSLPEPLSKGVAQKGVRLAQDNIKNRGPPISGSKASKDPIRRQTESRSSVIREKKSRHDIPSITGKEIIPIKLYKLEDRETQSIISCNINEPPGNVQILKSNASAAKEPRRRSATKGEKEQEDDKLNRRGTENLPGVGKINNQKLAMKVKSSLESGVPLKRITITDPCTVMKKRICNGRLSDFVARDVHREAADETKRSEKTEKRTKEETESFGLAGAEERMEDTGRYMKLSAERILQQAEVIFQKEFRNRTVSQDSVRSDKSDSQSGNSYKTWGSHKHREIEESKCKEKHPKLPESSRLANETAMGTFFEDSGIDNTISRVPSNIGCPSQTGKSSKSRYTGKHKKIPLDASVRHIVLKQQDNAKVMESLEEDLQAIINSSQSIVPEEEIKEKSR